MRSTPSYSSLRQPYPDHFFDEIGRGFVMGAIGGSIFHFIRGMHNSPNGERIFGGAQAIRMNAPRIGGSVAVFCGLFTVCDRCLVYLRQKEDPWNSIASGAAASGFKNMRKGLRYASRSALFGGACFGLLEGVGMMLDKALHDLIKERKAREL